MTISDTSSILRSRAIPALATVAVAVLIAGCGSSSSSSTITIGNENTADNALIKAGEKAGAATETTAKTPTTGPLSQEPTVPPQSGAPPTKLVTKDLIVGTGPEAKAGESVTVNYVGALYKGGKVFDASWKRHEPFSFVLGKGQVIPGWIRAWPA